MIRVSCVLVDRANYGRLLPILELLEKDPYIDLSVICCGSTVLDRFHNLAKDLQKAYKITHRIYHEVEGSNELSVVHSMSTLMPQLSTAFTQNNPDFVLIIGDRYEALAVATVASMMKLCLIHVQGGEQTGNIDDAIRNAISKLAMYHLPATQQAKNTLVAMGESAQSILGVGCPSADLALMATINECWVDHILCVYHPEDLVNSSSVVKFLLTQLEKYKAPVLMFWPNIDSGSEGIHKQIRRYYNQHDCPPWLKLFVNVDPITYMTMLKSVKGCVGNSSSFVRDASFFGTPVIALGNRQMGRLNSHHVKWISNTELESLYHVMNRHFIKKVKPSNQYGTPGISSHFVETLKHIPVKRLKVHYE